MLSAGEMERIAKEIAGILSEDQEVELLRSPAEIQEAVQGVLQENMEQERRLNADCDRVMDQYAREIDRGDVDPHKLFLMIKRKLAKDRGFVL